MKNEKNEQSPLCPGWSTIGREAHIEFTERKSVFLGHAKPVQTEEEALGFLRDIRHRYADAKHNVYAYALREGNTARYSDDGEPQGTAGIPVLDVIRKRGFTDAVIVVTRYFGGILLGTGGLVRAYGTAARMVCEEAGIVTYCQNTEAELRCDYTAYQKIAAELPNFGARVEQSDFAADVTLRIVMRSEVYTAFEKRICEITAGRAIPRVTSTSFGI